MAERPHPPTPVSIGQEWHQCVACLGWGRVRGARTYLETQRALREKGWEYTPSNGRMVCAECAARRSHPDRVILVVEF